MKAFQQFIYGVIEPELLVFAIVFSLGLLLLMVLKWRNLRRKMDGFQVTGHGIETKSLENRIEQVRTNYLAQAHPSAKEIWHRRAMVALARRALGRLSFFRKSSLPEHFLKADH